MAWITSATNRESVTGASGRRLQLGLLTAHLALLVIMLFERPTSEASAPAAIAATSLTPEIAAAPGAAASLALFTGLAMVAALFWSGRTRRPANDLTPATPATREAVAVARAPQARLAQAHDGLLARLNHDLRTPLNAIIGFADLMRAETFGPLGNERYRAYAAHMQSCGQDLLRATESTIAMASLLTATEAADREVIDLADLAGEAWQAAGERPGSVAVLAGLDIEVPAGLEVRGPRVALLQCLIDLFGLAAARSADTGTVKFRAIQGCGRVEATIIVTGAHCVAAPRTGCRAPSAAVGGVDELALGLSQALLGHHGVALSETCNQSDRWIVALSFEEAAQNDLFAPAGRSAAHGDARATDYSTGFFGAAVPSPSRSA